MKTGGSGGATFPKTESGRAAVRNEELRKKLLECYKGWHEPIGTFLANTHADERDYRNAADDLGGPLYGLCDLDAITPLCLGLV